MKSQRRAAVLAVSLLALAVGPATADPPECLPVYTAAVIEALYPGIGPGDWTIRGVAPGCTSWGATNDFADGWNPAFGPRPTLAQIEAAAPAILLVRCRGSEVADPAIPPGLIATQADAHIAAHYRPSEIAEAALDIPSPTVAAQIRADLVAVRAAELAAWRAAANWTPGELWACAPEWPAIGAGVTP